MQLKRNVVKKISLIEYIIEGGLKRKFNFKNTEDVLQLLNPSWIDKFKKSKTFCFNTNIGTLELSLNKYEQIDIDLDVVKEGCSICFIYKKRDLSILNFKEDKKSEIASCQYNEIDDTTTLILKNGINLHYDDGELFCISTKFIVK